ncbi:MAG: DoxX family protein [Bryobacteraceae bacterium]|nr:DoxX family protein [Bryobacteraceae bacterium]
MSRWMPWAPRLLSMLRIAAALTFLQSGFPIWAGRLGPQVNWLTSMLEVLAGGLMLLGWFTRPAGITLALMALLGYTGIHWWQGADSWLLGLREISVYIFLWLYLAAAGPGPWSIDERATRPGSRSHT